MILSKWNKQKWKNDVFAVKCAKRGNDVSRQRTKARFRGISNQDFYFFEPKERGKKNTSALFITLTYDTKLCSYKEAWKQIGVQFNVFMANVRRDFGKVSCLRVWESFGNGYPHIHCILLFEEHIFSVFRDSKGDFLVHEKDKIAKGWHSFIKVKGMSSLGRGFAYLKKYLLKSIDFENATSKELMTLALCWIFRKRAFSVSGKFRKALADLINRLHNSNKPLVQTTLLGEIISEEKYHLLGFVKGDDLQIEGTLWFVLLNSKQVSLLGDFLKEKSF